MDNVLVDVSFIRDTATVAAICAEVSSDGGFLICNGCGDVEALIAGVLVIDHAEEAWVLCGECIRKLPFEGAVA
jgi:hypothetical protein